MLQHAASRGIYRALHEADVTRSELPDCAFDLGISVLAACHLPDLSKLYAEAARLVRPSGWLAVVDYHPFFLLRGIPTHFDTASGPVAIENFVHLTSEHINCGIRCGWVPAEMHERLVDEQWGSEKPSMSKHLNQPVSFVLLWRK
jgi:SAM-dependent methyltransferase